MAAEPVAVGATDWATFRAGFDWRQGEHVALCGPTGQGKTTLIRSLVPLRKWVAVVQTKPRDRTMLGVPGFVRTDDWGRRHALDQRVILAPPWRDSRDNRRQARAIRDAIDAMYQEGAWCVVLDDLQHLVSLGLREQVVTLWLMARSLGISVVGATQRPRWVPLEMWSQSTHLFLWGTRDDDDLRRLGGIGGGVNGRTIRETVAALPRHDVLYVNTRTGLTTVTRAPKG